MSSVPGGVLGGITVVLYGMIGLLGAKIWKENGVDFGNPINLVPVAAGIIIGVGNVSLVFTEEFSLTGIALGTIVAVGAYHLARALAPEDLRCARTPSTTMTQTREAMYGDSDGVDDLYQDKPGGPDLRKKQKRWSGLTDRGLPMRHRGPTRRSGGGMRRALGRSCQTGPHTAAHHLACC